MVEPVVYEANGDAKKTSARAGSSGLPKRAIGMPRFFAILPIHSSQD